MILYLFLDSLCHFVQNIVAFTIMNRLTRLSYAVANATKRIVVITSSLLFLQNHVTGLNVVGMSMAIGGVLAYNKVKLDEKRARETLPSTAANGDAAVGRMTTLPLWNGSQYSSPKVQLLAPSNNNYRAVNGKYRPYQA